MTISLQDCRWCIINIGSLNKLLIIHQKSIVVLIFLLQRFILKQLEYSL